MKVTISPQGGGTYTDEIEAGYDSGSTRHYLTATPAAGYSFVRWEGTLYYDLAGSLQSSPFIDTHESVLCTENTTSGSRRWYELTLYFKKDDTPAVGNTILRNSAGKILRNSAGKILRG